MDDKQTAHGELSARDELTAYHELAAGGGPHGEQGAGSGDH